MEAAGITSARQLGEAAGIGKDAAIRAIRGGQSSSATLRQIAAALHVKIARIEELRGHAIPEPVELPEGAERLTDTQRSTLRAVVRAMLEPALAESTATVHEFPARDRMAARKGPHPKRADASDDTP